MTADGHIGAEDSARARGAVLSLRQIALSIGGIWLAYFILTSLRGFILAYEFEHSLGLDLYGDMLWRRLVVCAGGILVTVLLWLALRFFDRSMMRWQIGAALVLALPGAALIAQINQSLFAPVESRISAAMAEAQEKDKERERAEETFTVEIDPSVLPEDVSDQLEDALSEHFQKERRKEKHGKKGHRVDLAVTTPFQWMALIDVALSRYLLLVAWASLYFTMLSAENARAAERRGEQFRHAARAAELRSLRYQVNPHFLFNALNSLSALVMTGRAERAENMIQALSDFYRHSLTEGMTGDVLLADEFALQGRYLDIEAIRFPERLRAEFILPAALENIHVPGLILQPLIENAVKHGVARTQGAVKVRVEAKIVGDHLEILVSDNGSGSAAPSAGFGIGLNNVRDRLQAAYGEEAKLISGREGNEYCSRLILPLMRPKESE